MTERTPDPAHEVRVLDGRFSHAECNCGWRGAGRRTRSTARAEAHDHALLYADGRGSEHVLVLHEVEEPVVIERTGAEA